MFYNIQGLLSHLAELTAAIRLSSSPPAMICLNETFLDESIEDVPDKIDIVVLGADRAKTLVFPTGPSAETVGIDQYLP